MDAALKQHYTSDRVENMVFKDNPFFAMVSKYKNFDGRNLPVPIKYGLPQGISSTFSTAQTNITNTYLKAFLLTRAKHYSVASIDNETIEASKNDSGAFLSALTLEIDGAIEGVARELAVALFRDGSGAIGQSTSAITSGTSLTLLLLDDSSNFEVGMVLSFSSTTTGAVKTGVLSVTAINRDTGVITLSAAGTTIDGGTGIAASDYIFRQGNQNLGVTGLSGWLPGTAPSPSESFFGVDRSADATRLAGIRYDGRGMPIEEALVDAAAKVGQLGGRPDYCFLSYTNYAALEKALGSKVQYIDKNITPEIGFRGILVHGPRGPISVIPDQNCPGNRAFMLSMEYWKLYSLGDAPKIIQTDGMKFLRDSSADSVQVRVGAYAQLGCRAPGFNANIQLS